MQMHNQWHVSSFHAFLISFLLWIYSGYRKLVFIILLASTLCLSFNCCSILVRFSCPNFGCNRLLLCAIVYLHVVKHCFSSWLADFLLSFAVSNSVFRLKKILCAEEIFFKKARFLTVFELFADWPYRIWPTPGVSRWLLRFIANTHSRQAVFMNVGCSNDILAVCFFVGKKSFNNSFSITNYGSWCQKYIPNLTAT